MGELTGWVEEEGLEALYIRNEQMKRGLSKQNKEKKIKQIKLMLLNGMIIHYPRSLDN